MNGAQESDYIVAKKLNFVVLLTRSRRKVAAVLHSEKVKTIFSIFLCGDIDPISGLTVNITELKPIIGDILSLVDHKIYPSQNLKNFLMVILRKKILEYLVANIQPKLERLPVQLTKAV